MHEKNERLLRLPEGKEPTGYGLEPSIYRKVRLGEFPCPYSLGGRAVAWKASEYRCVDRRPHKDGKDGRTVTAAVFADLVQAQPTGAGRWKARCPAHNDRSPSLSIREGDDGRVLVLCRAGCSLQTPISPL